MLTDQMKTSVVHYVVSVVMVDNGHIKQLPTFYLNENVQGIVNEEHARNIVRHIVDPYNRFDGHVEIHVYKV